MSFQAPQHSSPRLALPSLCARPPQWRPRHRQKAASGAPLAEFFTELTEKTRTDIVLIIDQMQHAKGIAAGNDLVLVGRRFRRIEVSPKPSPGDRVGPLIIS